MHPSEIHCGEIFYECGGFGNVKMKAITAPYEEDGVWKWKARRIDTGEIVNYVWTSYAYGPELYDHPAYAVPGAGDDVEGDWVWDLGDPGIT